MKWLTKSDYLKFLIHPAYLWLAKHDKERLPEFSEIGKANVAQGYAVEAAAAALFPDARLVDVPMFDGPDETTRLMRAGGPEILLQASILTDRKLYVRSDVIVRHQSSWDLYEIKGSASIKPAHLLDLAFQRYVFQEAGHTIGRSYVVHINSDYARQGDIDPSQLFSIVDVTDQIEPLHHKTSERVEQALEVLAAPTMPPDGPDLANDWYAYRDIYAHLHPELSPDSIYKLTRLSLEQIKALAQRHVTRIQDIPDDFELKPQQQAQIALARSGRPHIKAPEITGELAGLRFPLYFLDYETFASALPMWDGVRPFQQLPFQYSLHILQAPDKSLEHTQYLGKGSRYPVADLCHQLEQVIGATGSVIVWNKSFETGCNDAMAALHPEYAAFLSNINVRVYDLMEIFSNGLYGHPGFQGSASIKKVLPVLVPELSYRDLGIGEGLTAQIRWMQAARGELSADAAAQIYADLEEYCGQDTLAMVRIYEVLKRL